VVCRQALWSNTTFQPLRGDPAAFPTIMRLAFVITKPPILIPFVMQGAFVDVLLDWFVFGLQPPSEIVS
jgi:hypothetical protein